MLHKLVQAGGERYLPFALSRLRALKMLGVPYLEQRFTVEGIDIKVSIVGDQEYIRIGGGGASYEFFVSDAGIYTDAAHGFTFPHNAALFTDVSGDSSVGAVVVGCGVSTRKSGGASPKFANTLAPLPSSDPSYKYWPVLPIPTGALAAGGPVQTKFATGDYSRPLVGNTWQDQKFGEHTWWYNNQSNVLVTSCLGVPKGRLASTYATFLAGTTPFGWHVANGYSLFNSFNKIPNDGRQFNAGEISGSGIFDVLPSVFTKNYSYEIGYKRNALAAWRTAAVQKVNGQYYMICSDHQGSFSCYRVRDYTGVPEWGATIDYSNIPGVYVQVATPAYPSWVTVPLTTDTYPDQWSWRFNKDGTKAVSTPFERVASWMWVAADNISLSGGVLTNNPRTSLPGEAGDGSTAHGYPSVGIRWPVESFLSGQTATYTVVRSRVYQQRSPLGQRSKTAVYVQGKFYATYNGRRSISTPGADANGLVPEETFTDYDPAFICKPGLVEVGFTITVADPTHPDNFTFAVTVLQEEAYTVNKRYYVDADYYAVNKRTTSVAGMPADDTLVTAEIEVQYESAYPPIVATNSTNGYGTVSTSTVPSYVAFTNNYNYTLADEPNCEAAWLCNYDIGAEVSYVIRQRSGLVEVKRFSLAHNVQWQVNGFWKNYTSQAAHVGAIMFADLKSMNFITKSFSSKATDRITGTGGSGGDWVSVGPRYELRILGEALKTINYADSTVCDYATDSDPMVNKTALSGHVKLPVTYSAGTGCPDSLLLAVQLFTNASLLPNGTDLNIATHPNGHWSCHQRTDGTGWTLNPTYSTETAEAFDFIRPFNGTATTHKAAFNTAFGQSRDYSYYQTLGESGSFCTYGIWYDIT